jgi:hypothetical protein
VPDLVVSGVDAHVVDVVAVVEEDRSPGSRDAEATCRDLAYCADAVRGSLRPACRKTYSVSPEQSKR